MHDKKYEELEHEIMKLSPESRANLAEKLIRSLEAEQHAEIEAAWIQEVERRYRAIQDGDVTVLESDEVFQKIRSKL